MIRNRAWLTFPPLRDFASFSIARRGRGAAGGWRRLATPVTSRPRPENSSREKYGRLAVRSTSAVNSRGMGVPGEAAGSEDRRIVPGFRGSRPSRSEGTNRVEGGPAPVAQGPPKQNNSPTPLLGTAMISYFWRGAVFFSPLRYSGGTRTVRGRVTHVGLARLF